MKFEKEKIYYDVKSNEILKYSHKYNGMLYFTAKEVKNGVLKTWGNLRIAKRIYSEKEAQKLIEYTK